VRNIDLERPQRFSVSHLDEVDFKSDGLRPYSRYRDLGIAAATNGLATAHVIRMVAPFTEDYGTRHHHDVQFQLVYVLKGWFKNEFEGEGVHVMRAGSCWIQPPGIHHTVLGWSDDCELLEIVLPADFATANDP
jgi:mannose-6-phosphate isomerase-like protein (cupin superfamily)